MKKSTKSNKDNNYRKLPFMDLVKMIDPKMDESDLGAVAEEIAYRYKYRYGLSISELKAIILFRIKDIFNGGDGSLDGFKFDMETSKICRIDPNVNPLFSRDINPKGLKWLLWILYGRPRNWVKTVPGILGNIKSQNRTGSPRFNDLGSKQ